MSESVPEDATSTSNTRAAALLLRYARAFVPHYAVGVVFLLLTNFAVVRIPTLIGNALDVLSAGGPAALHDARGLAAELMVWAVALIFVRTASRVLFFNPGREIEYRLTNDLFSHLLLLQRPFHARHKVGELVSVASNDTQSVRLLVGFAGLQVFNVAVAVPLHLGSMLLTDPVLTAWCIVPIAIGGVYMRLTVRRFYALVRDSLDSLARLSDRVLESYAGIVTIRAHAAEEAALARFDERNAAYLDIQHRIATMRAFSMPVLGFSGLLGTGIVLLVGGQRVMAGEMMVGAMATFTALLVSLVSLLTSLAWVLASVSRGMIAMGRVDGLLSAVDDDPLGTKPVRLEVPPAIAIRDLSFRYPGADKPALTGVSVELPAGKTLGIFGKTGSGKSTLVALLARTWVPTPGQIFLDGHDLATLDRRVLRERVSIVPQSPFLFSTTVRENIRLVGERPPDLEADARSDAAITDREAVRRAVAAEPDARLREVLEDVTLMEDVAGLPRGLDTVVGERGVILSGGQRQRAALARALYKKPALLLLDDVLSAVDQATEARLVAAIRGIARGEEGEEGEAGEPSAPTTVIVSNRTSVLEHADLVLVLDDGKVVDRGTHAELAARPGIYASAHQQQTKGRGQAGAAPGPAITAAPAVPAGGAT